MRDPGDFDAFYVGTRQRLLHCVYLVTGNQAEAQDAVQEAYIRAWQRWGSVSGYNDPEAWVRLVACRIAISRWRRFRRSLDVVRLLGSSLRHESPQAVAVSLDLAKALQSLPAPQRLAITLHHLIGMSVSEIAEQTGTPAGTIKARLARGRQTLAQLLGPTMTDSMENANV